MLHIAQDTVIEVIQKSQSSGAENSIISGFF
jgi:hypothetical protein